MMKIWAAGLTDLAIITTAGGFPMALVFAVTLSCLKRHCPKTCRFHLIEAFGGVKKQQIIAPKIVRRIDFLC